MQINDWNDYQNLAVRTRKTFDTHDLALAYYSLGLVGEATEVLATVRALNAPNTNLTAPDLHKELGDVLWYTAVVAYEVGIDLNLVGLEASTFGVEEEGELKLAVDLVIAAGIVGEKMKKVVRDGRKVDVQDTTEKLAHVMVDLEALAKRYNATLGQVAQWNIAKLEARYPKGYFTTKDAIARADGEELRE